MRISYTLRFRDYFLFNLVHQFLLLTNQLLFLGAAIAFGWIESIGGHAGRGWMVGWVVYVVLWVFQALLNWVVLHSKKNRALLTGHVIEVSADQFTDRTDYCVSHYQWRGLVSVVSRPGFVAVYTAAHAACIIPNRAFADGIERQRFIDMVRGSLAGSFEKSGSLG